MSTITSVPSPAALPPGHEQFTLEDPHLKDVTLMIGSAEEDIAYNEREIGVPPTIRALDAKGLPYIPYFVTGSPRLVLLAPDVPALRGSRALEKGKSIMV